MKSKSFSKAKRVRFKTKNLANEVRYIKKQRIRKDRRLNRLILKLSHNQDSIKNIILRNDGNREVI
jgi:hypothetical protein